MVINEMPMIKAGEKYKVSDNAVRKWCKEYGIEWRRSPGYWSKKR
jgi:uncharacterized protein YjcR